MSFGDHLEELRRRVIWALAGLVISTILAYQFGSEIIKMGLKDKNDTLIQQGWRIAEKNQAKIFDLVMDMLSYSKDRVPAVDTWDRGQVQQGRVVGDSAEERGEGEEGGRDSG
jgi:hypothetical protein